MSHELDNTYGYENSMAYVGDTPWHRLGRKIAPGLTVNEAIAACPAVNFDTLTVPVKYVSGGQYLEAKGHRVIIRSDTHKALGVATSRYSPVQLADQWAGLDPLIRSGLASIETLGSIEGGRRVWGLVKLNAREIKGWDDLIAEVGELQPYALTLEDKTGKRSAIIAPTSVRAVCRNTLEAGLSGLTKCVKVRHTGDTAAKMAEAAEELWGTIVDTYQRLGQRYRALNAVTLDMDQFNQLVLDEIAVLPTDPTKYASKARYMGARNRAIAKRDTVYRLWFDGAGHKGNSTAWEALNGAIEALDWNESGVFRTPKGSKKVSAMLTGTEAQMKSRITANLLTFAQDRIAA